MNETPYAVDEEHSRGHHDVHEDSKSATHVRLDRLGDIKGSDEWERAASQSYKLHTRKVHLPKTQEEE